MEQVVVALTLNHIGDVLFTEPAVTALKFGIPNSKLVVITSPEAEPILEGHFDIDEIWVRSRNIQSMVHLAIQLRKIHPSVVVSFSPSSFGLALLSWLSGAPKRVGFAERPFIKRMFTVTSSFSPDRHIVDDYLTLAQAAGGKMKYKVPHLFFQRGEQENALRWLNEQGWDGHTPLIGCHPFSSVLGKRWRLENFAELLRWCSNELGYCAIVFGSFSEREESTWLAERVGAINAVGKLSLRQFIAMVSLCSGFIGGDSGPVHTAASLGVPTLALFGPTTPQRTGPLGKQVKVIRSPNGSMDDLPFHIVQKEALQLWTKTNASLVKNKEMTGMQLSPTYLLKGDEK